MAAPSRSEFARGGRESALRLPGRAELVTLKFEAAADAEETEFAPEVTGGEVAGPGAEPVSASLRLQSVSIGTSAPEEFALRGAYPNPARGQATVEVDLPSKAAVTVEVYNPLGQRVQVAEQAMSAGTGQTIQLDAAGLASGQYFYRVEAEPENAIARETGRITIVR